MDGAPVVTAAPATEIDELATSSLGLTASVIVTDPPAWVSWKSSPVTDRSPSHVMTARSTVTGDEMVGRPMVVAIGISSSRPSNITMVPHRSVGLVDDDQSPTGPGIRPGQIRHDVGDPIIAGPCGVDKIGHVGHRLPTPGGADRVVGGDQ